MPRLVATGRTTQRDELVRVKLGVILPTFSSHVTEAFEVADEATRLGLDGVFAYDHLWPMNSPTRPALAPFPVLAAIAARHEQLIVGPLVARVGLVGTTHLVEQFLTLHALAPGRVIAALGTGDRLSSQENEAYGLTTLSALERRQLVGETASALSSTMPIWIGGGADATNALARTLHAEINLWNANPDQVAQTAQSGPVNWAGPLASDVAQSLGHLRDVGATWAVLASMPSGEQVAKLRQAT